MGDRERSAWSYTRVTLSTNEAHSEATSLHPFAPLTRDHESESKSKARDAGPHPEKAEAGSAFRRERRHRHASGSQMERSRNYALTDFVAAQTRRFSAIQIPLARSIGRSALTMASLLSVLVVNLSLVVSGVR
jgi:hypothetical protein